MNEIKKPKHKFSFTAFFENGEEITQNHLFDDDYSKLVENSSRFGDVLEKSKESPLVSFVIHNENNYYGVDLTDGHFEFNGVLYWQHNPSLEILKDFKVIYYRTVNQQVNMADKTSIGDGEVVGYCIGWEATNDRGKKVKKEFIIGC